MRGALPPDITEVVAVHNQAQSFTSLESGLLGRRRDVRRDDNVCRVKDAIEVPN